MRRPKATTDAKALAELFRNAPLPPARLLGPPASTSGPPTVLETVVIVDLDLDTGVATELDSWTSPHRPAQGVYALVWHHGEPVGNVTVLGEPSEIIPVLRQTAGQYVQRAVLEHQLRDALAHRWDVANLSLTELLAIEHPERPPVNGEDVTIAVCTRNRAPQLRDCLASIAGLRSRVAEVLVVDNAPEDATTRGVAADFPFVRYVQEPRAGLDWARNRALLEARTDIVAFTDDDAVVHASWVEGLLRAFTDEPDAVAVGGLVVAAELMTPAQIVFERPGGFARGYRRQWFATAVDDGRVAAAEHPGMGKAGTGANIAVRRRLALGLGGFDPALDVGTATGGGGDVEFLFRAVAAGGLVVYEPAAVVRHRHRRTMAELVRQKRGDGTGTYSIYTGSSRHYGRRQQRAFRQAAVRWALRHLGVGYVRSLLAPALWPRALVRAEISGAVSATVGQYYRRAQREAERQAAQYPDHPAPPPLVRSPALRGGDDGLRTASIRVDLADPAAPQLPGHSVAGVTVEVLCGGRSESSFIIDTGGQRLTLERLQCELAAHVNDRAGPGVRARSPLGRFRASLGRSR